MSSIFSFASGHSGTPRLIERENLISVIGNRNIWIARSSSAISVENRPRSNPTKYTFGEVQEFTNRSRTIGGDPDLVSVTVHYYPMSYGKANNGIPSKDKTIVYTPLTKAFNSTVESLYNLRVDRFPPSDEDIFPPW